MVSGSRSLISVGVCAALIALLSGSAIAQSKTTFATLIVPKGADPTFTLTADGPFDAAFPHYMLLQKLKSVGESASACILKKGDSNPTYAPGVSNKARTYLIHAFGGTGQQLFTIYGGISGSGDTRSVDLKDKDFANLHGENGHLTILVKFPAAGGNSSPSVAAVKGLTPKFGIDSALIPAGISPC